MGQDQDVEKGREKFVEAVAKAGLPVFPIVRVEAVSEDDDEDR